VIGAAKPCRQRSQGMEGTEGHRRPTSSEEEGGDLEQGERGCSPARSRSAADSGVQEGEDKTTPLFSFFLTFFSSSDI
jgi:hypothetical protein